MKRSKILIVFIAAIVGLGGCSKSAINPSGLVLMGATVKTTLGVSSWQTSQGTASLSTYPKMHLIVEGDNNNNNIHLELNNYSGVGTYDISNDKVSYFGTVSFPNQVNYGQVLIDSTATIGESKTVIWGRFNFSTDTKDTISQGQFTATLILN
jgi:hypothetical protein